MDVIRGFLVDVKNGKAGEINIEKGLQSLYNICNCDLIDIATREIGGHRYDVVCDDEGTLKDGFVLSAVNGRGQPMFVGNLFICSHNEDGDLISLNDKQIKNLYRNVKTYIHLRKGAEKTIPVLCNVEYLS